MSRFESTALGFGKFNEVDRLYVVQDRGEFETAGDILWDGPQRERERDGLIQ